MPTSAQPFVHDRFAEYYRENYSLIEPPQSIERREFGFLLLRERMMVRHRSFKNADEFRSFLRSTAPSHAYYSSAYYAEPEKPMGEKGWLGADLVFDIDADHIPTPCGKAHDRWTCDGCGFVGRGEAPGKCPSCGQQKFDEKIWPCEVCLESAKTETMKLLDVLMKDFGFSARELRVGFSGHRGYHVHVENEGIKSLDSMARKEIVDYLIGIGLETSFHGVKLSGEERTGIVVGPDLRDAGWRGRLAKGTYDLLQRATPEELKELGLREGVVNNLVKHRETLLQSWKEGGSGFWGGIRNVGLKGWEKMAQYGAEDQSVKIDTVVTTDIHRLIRLNNTLHGKTGFKKIEVPITEIEGFDPFKEAIAFDKGAVMLSVAQAPKFRIGDKNYGPYENQRIELPTAAALFLVCKGAATVVN